MIATDEVQLQEIDTADDQTLYSHSWVAALGNCQILFCNKELLKSNWTLQHAEMFSMEKTHVSSPNPYKLEIAPIYICYKFQLPLQATIIWLYKRKITPQSDLKKFLNRSQSESFHFPLLIRLYPLNDLARVRTHHSLVEDNHNKNCGRHV